MIWIPLNFSSEFSFSLFFLKAALYMMMMIVEKQATGMSAFLLKYWNNCIEKYFTHTTNLFLV